MSGDCHTVVESIRRAAEDTIKDCQQIVTLQRYGGIFKVCSRE